MIFDSGSFFYYTLLDEINECMKNAHLILSDGTVYSGKSFGADVMVDGEVVFNTGMVGYPQTLTDPSYRGQILVTTYPLQGNYGVPDFHEKDEYGLHTHFESGDVHIRALIVSDYCDQYHHWEAKESLGDFLKEHNVPGITGIDTRALTKHLREHGVMLGKIVISDTLPTKKDVLNIVDPNESDLVKEVVLDEVKVYGKGKKKICLVDIGVKENIIRSLLRLDTTVIRVPYDYPFMDGSIQFDGLFLSNGPGDPAVNKKTIAEIKKAIDADVNIFGICMGNQLLALASGGKTYKLKYGHRGQNQPCVDVMTHKCIITSQNHGFAVDAKTLPKGVQVWFENANDRTNEGIRYKKGNIRSVQFHPEATPGPQDASYLFEEFVKSV